MSKINIPLHMCENAFRATGKETRNLSFTNMQIGQQIRALRNIIAYFEGRGDAGIIVNKLRLELDHFESCKYFREND